MKPDLHIEPEVIVRKAKAHGHAHHGGAWKIAYADFVTAMMAFFMLMWIIGATDEQKRKGIADFFAPTLIETRRAAGGLGVMGGESPEVDHGASEKVLQPGRVAVLSGGRPDPDARRGDQRKRMDEDRERFRRLAQALRLRLASDPRLKGLARQLKLSQTREGLRIELVDRADFAMFALGTDRLLPDARALLATVATAVAGLPNGLAVRGHTDALGYAGPGSNWTLSTRRADAVRRALMDDGLAETRFRRIEGVAATEPWNAADGRDPRNRRISITLLWAAD